ncbi:MAG: TlpA disulfide reductase family protein [Balneolaceae bacterium]|nr:TlpA disulfide reductase family protein [Balneolaceae bacterium]
MNESDTGNKSGKSGKWFGKRDLIEWTVILAVGVVLYTTGWHTEVLGRLQQAVLWTGLIQPDTELAEAEHRSVSMDMDLLTLDGGEPVNLSEFRGRVIFLNYWATWCPPCIAEMPNIQSLYERYRDNSGIAFVMVSTDEEIEKAEAYLERKGYTFPVYRLAAPRPRDLRSTVLPTTFVISKSGEVVVKKRGMANYNTRDFRQLLNQLIAR